MDWTASVHEFSFPQYRERDWDKLNLSVLLLSHFFRRLSPSAFDDGNMNLVIGAIGLCDVRSCVVSFPQYRERNWDKLILSLLLASFFRRLSHSAFDDGNLNLVIGAKGLSDVRSWVVFSVSSSIHLWQSTFCSMFPRGISLLREFIPFKISSVCSVLVLFVLTLHHKMATQPNTVYSLHSFYTVITYLG
jgi:hypothetical protein